MCETARFLLRQVGCARGGGGGGGGERGTGGDDARSRGRSLRKKDFVLPPSFFASERWLPLLLLRLLAFAAVVLSVLTGAACLWMCGGVGFAKRRRRNARSEANLPARISRGGKRRQTHQPPPPPPDERKNEGGRVVRSFGRSPELRRRRPKERSSRVWSGGEGLTVYVRKRERGVCLLDRPSRCREKNRLRKRAHNTTDRVSNCLCRRQKIKDLHRPPIQENEEKIRGASECNWRCLSSLFSSSLLAGCSHVATFFRRRCVTERRKVKCRRKRRERESSKGRILFTRK